MELSFARIGNFKHTAVKYLLVTSIEPEPSPSDGDLIASAAAGEREAFVAIYERVMSHDWIDGRQRRFAP